MNGIAANIKRVTAAEVWVIDHIKPIKAVAKPSPPIITDKSYGKSSIKKIKTEQILKFLKNNQVAIISGFQGISEENRITTLGRGGSDTSAVAIAASFSAERCDIYTDVDGVYTTDPRIVKKAKKLDQITYEEMLELASQGAKVLQTRSVALAMKYSVKYMTLYNTIL